MSIKTLEQVIKANPDISASKALEIFKEQETKGISKKLKTHLKNKELCKEMNNEGVLYFSDTPRAKKTNVGYAFYYKLSNFTAVNPVNHFQNPFINCECETILIYINPADRINDDEVFSVKIEREIATAFDFNRTDVYQKISETEYNEVRFKIQQLKNKLQDGK